MANQTVEFVPLLDLKRQYEQIREQVAQAIERVCESQRFILGDEVSAFEQEVAALTGVEHAVGVSSGTDALIAGLLELGVGIGETERTGAEVITSPYSFFATASSISRVGARPVFVDIEPQSFNLDPQCVEKVISSDTKAIMPVHLFGQCVDCSQVVELAKSHNLNIIEDAAQAIGAEDNGVKAGALGTLGCFSFFPSKNLGGFGDGGMVVCHDAERAEHLRSLRMHGSSRQYYHDELGGNFRLDALQAAVLRVKLGYLEQWTVLREKHAEEYRELFVQAELAPKEWSSTEELNDWPVLLPSCGNSKRHVYNQFVIRCRNRDALRKHLSACGIGAQVYYPLGLHMQPCFSYLGYSEGDFPQCELAATQSLALPIFPELTYSEVQRVVYVIAEFYRGV